MSLNIIGIDKTGNEMTVLTDKRVSKEIDGSFVSDDSVKIKVIREDLVYIGSSYSRKQDLIAECIDQLRDLPASQIIDKIKAWDKSFEKNEGEFIDIQIKLAGAYDDGRLFYFAHQEDGTSDLFFASPGNFSFAVSTPDDYFTNKAQEFITDSMKVNSFNDTLPLTCSYMSVINKQISPAYDKYIIKRSV